MNTRQVNGYFCAKDTRMSGMGIIGVDDLLAPIASVIGGGLNVWNTIEQQELLQKAAQQQATLQRQQAAQQAAGAIYSMQELKLKQASSGQTQNFIMLAMILGGAGILGYTIIKGMTR